MHPDLHSKQEVRAPVPQLEEAVLKNLALATIFLALWSGRLPAADFPGEEQPVRYFQNFTRNPLPEGAVSDPETGQPIILIVIDALRPDHLGCYGYGRDTSPMLDKFADQGIIFTRYFANSSWTRTATTSMLTGRIPTRHAVQCDKHKLQASIPTVTEQLKKAGYATLAVVGNGNASSAFGLNKGFDVFEDTTRNWKGLPRAKQVYDKGLELLRRYRGKKKVFLFLFVLDTHDPYRPAPPYDEMFLPGYHGKIVHSPRWEPNNAYPKEVREKIVALYDGLIRFTDDQTKVFFDKLDRLGFYNRSSIFITADHGEAFGEHGVYKHGYQLYETHLRVPLLIRAPWLKVKGKYSSAFVQQLDLFPTFCQLAGARVPDDLQGISIIDALKDRSSVPVPRYVLSEYKCYGIKRTSIRTRGYKLIYQQPADREQFMKTVKKPELLPSVSFDREVFSLFNVLKDPYERKNIWTVADQKLKNRLLELLKDEIDEKKPPKKIKNLDPQLVEELRSLGYVQ
jgi:arylsulfatase A-like enzyme